MKLCEDEDEMPVGTDFETTIHDDINKSLEETGKEQKKRKCSTALYVDEKRRKLEKNLSAKQRDSAMIQVMRDDLALKKKSISVEESSKNADSNALIKIADSMQMLSQAIMTGFNHLASLNQQSQQQFPQQYPVPGNINHVLPCQQNGINLNQVIPFPQAPSHLLIQNTDFDQLVRTVIKAQPIAMKTQNRDIYRRATRVGTFEVCVAGHIALRMLSAITPAR